MSVSSIERTNHERLAWGLCLVGLAVRLILLTTPITTSLDTWRQADTASIAHHFLVNGFRLFYPQIYWGGAGPGYVEAEFQLYPFVVAALYAFFGEQVWLGRMVSLLFAVPTFFVFYQLARRVLPASAALWALGFFVTSPLYVRYSVAFMPEAAVMFFYVGALYTFQKWLEEGSPQQLWLAAGSTAFAILVKPTSIHIGLLFALLARERFSWSVFRHKALWAAGAASLIPGAIWYLHARNLYLTYGNTFGILSGGDNKFGNITYWTLPSFYVSLIRLEVTWVFAYIGALFFVIGLGVAIVKRRPLIVLWGYAVMGIYYLIVARYAQELWGIQYHVYAVPFAALGVGLGCEWCLQRLSQRFGAALMVGSSAVMIALSTDVYASSIDPSLNASVVDCARFVKALVPPEARLAVSSASAAVVDGQPNNYQEPTLFFLSDRYGWSLAADQHTPDKLMALQQAGASFFVVSRPQPLLAAPTLRDYLTMNAEQIGPGLEQGCAIYRLQP